MLSKLNFFYQSTFVNKQPHAYKAPWAPYQALNEVVIKVSSNISGDEAENLQAAGGWKQKNFNKCHCALANSGTDQLALTRVTRISVCLTFPTNNIFPYICKNFLYFFSCLFILILITGHHWEESDYIFFMPPHWVFKYIDEMFALSADKHVWPVQRSEEWDGGEVLMAVEWFSCQSKSRFK